MDEGGRLPRRAMLLIAGVQGIALLYLKNATESGYWPSESPLANFPAWTLALALPVLLLLSLERGRNARLLRETGIFAVLLVLVAAYTGSQARPFDAFPVDALVVAFGLSIALACFKALMYLQQRAAGKPMDYGVLFTYSWRNFLTLGLALVMTLAFWLVLRLWALLFETIGIDFFLRLFEMDWFIIPVLSIAHGFGIIVFRNLQQVIDGITRLLQGLIKLLLPLIVAVAVIFIGTLPFVGLDALWSTGRGTALLLWLLAVVLFFVNAVYQDGRDSDPYPQAVHRLLYAGICVLPVVSVLACYGLWLRVDQYGWTVERSWAGLTWLVLTLFAIGYVVGIVRRRDGWTRELGRVNTGMGLVVLALMLLANSPVLDFRKLAASSQLARLDAAEIELAGFDFWYADRYLARPGHLLLAELRQRTDDPDLIARIESPEPGRRMPAELSADEFWSLMRYRPADIDIPGGLRAAIYPDHARMYSRPQVESEPVLVRVDINEDGRPEYLLASFHGLGLAQAVLFVQQESGWQNLYLAADGDAGARSRAEVNVLEGEIGLRERTVRDLTIGDITFRVNEPGTSILWPADMPAKSGDDTTN